MKHTLRLFGLSLFVFVLFFALNKVQVVDAQQLAQPILVINTGALNVRSGPGPQYSVVTVVRGGTEVPVLGTNSNNSWYLVATAAGAGWVDISFTLPRGNFSYVPLVSAPPVATPAVQVPNSIALPTTSPGTTLPVAELQYPEIIVNTGRLNVRSGPGGQYTILTSVPGGTSLAPVGVTTDGVWYLVDGAFGRGWVAAEYTVFRGVYDNIPLLTSAYGY